MVINCVRFVNSAFQEKTAFFLTLMYAAKKKSAGLCFRNQPRKDMNYFVKL